MGPGRLLLIVAVSASAAWLGGGCQPIQENAPRGSGFEKNWPHAATTAVGPDGGGALDLDTACNGSPVAAKSVADCDVSFKTDIYPLISTDPVKSCVSGPSCHGGSDARLRRPLGGTSDTTPDNVWNTLVTFNFRDRDNAALAYVDICSTNPDDSAITCNLDFTDPCGTPMPDLKPMADTDKELIRKWLTCGAPNN